MSKGTERENERSTSRWEFAMDMNMYAFEVRKPKSKDHPQVSMQMTTAVSSLCLAACILSNPPNQESANFSPKGSEDKYLRFYELHSLCHNYSTLSVLSKSSHRQ